MKKLASGVVLVVLALTLIWAAGQQHGPLLAQRREFIPGNAEITKEWPPVVVFSVLALGGFRGLIADALWLRATKLQQDGKIFELVQLADWITKLEPRFTQVWSFHAWNLAYNVSVMLNEPSDRWRWVQEGVSMLRDRALIYNPGDAQLYWDLGWLYQHKIGQTLDQAHFYYKKELVLLMEPLLKDGSPNYEALANAPHDINDLLQEPSMTTVLEQIRAEGVDPLHLENLLALETNQTVSTLKQSSPAFSRLIASLQKERLHNTLRLDTGIMKEVDAEHGTLDWRLADTHSIYWAYQGQRHAAGFIKLQLDRMIFQSMSSAFRHGRLFKDVLGNMIPSPNLDLLPWVRKFYLHALEERPDNESIQTAYKNFLLEALAMLVSFNRVEEALALFEDYHNRYQDEDSLRGFDYFVAKILVGSMEDLNSRRAHAMIQGLAQQGLLAYALGDEERYAGFSAQAGRLWKLYRSQFKTDEHWERMQIPTYGELQRDTLKDLIKKMEEPTLKARLQQLLGPVNSA